MLYKSMSFIGVVDKKATPQEATLKCYFRFVMMTHLQNNNILTQANCRQVSFQCYDKIMAVAVLNILMTFF